MAIGLQFELQFSMCQVRKKGCLVLKYIELSQGQLHTINVF